MHCHPVLHAGSIDRWPRFPQPYLPCVHVDGNRA